MTFSAICAIAAWHDLFSLYSDVCFVGLTPNEYRPSNSSQLVGYRDNHHTGSFSSAQFLEPLAYLVAVAFQLGKYGSSTVDE